ncbi:MAG: DNA-directed DNA polymerase [Candidatus Micrarchaeaceae archaeon]
MEHIELEGVIVDIDYVSTGDRSVIRITLKSAGKIYSLFDPSFYPYFFLNPHNQGIDESTLAKMEIIHDGEKIGIHSATRSRLNVAGKEASLIAISSNSTRSIPKLSEHLAEFGQRFEYDILFWKRYLIDKNISPLSGVKAKAHEEDGKLIIDDIGPGSSEPSLTHLCFDIETYNPNIAPRPDIDPCIMISYANNERNGVITTKPIDRPFVTLCKDEKSMILEFVKVIKEMDPDIIVGYNSSNFDVPYLMKRSKKLGIPFDITRYGEEAREEHHGLIQSVKIPGRINLDEYNVARFVSIVGASEKLLKINRFTLGDVYGAITGDVKVTVDKKNIWQQWDGSKEELEILAEYSLSDSLALNHLYNFFLPIEVEVSKVAATTLAEAAVSTTGQLVEYLLMRYATMNKEVIPNRPSEDEISSRLSNPIEGAYVKTPEAGIYDNMAVFDFRGLYPSIIIANNIDPSTICKDCTEFFESPLGTKFKKEPKGIVPKVLELLISERSEIKKKYKKDPDNKFLAARSQALKILANSFYGYLGYARSRWYSRDCAGSVTAFGREVIAKTMDEAEKSGFKVLYGDTDSIFILMQGRSKEDVLKFLDGINKELPGAMELELEDFYVRGVFVGKKGKSESGAKKKYALLSEAGRIKIRGFELVRRDWSNISRETQRKVLEAILKEGSKEKALNIVKEVVQNLKDGNVNMKDLVIYTQLRKKIGSYDSKSPELNAAKRAIDEGVKRRDELEGATIGYIITKNGNSISEKAEIEDTAKTYDPDYYINHQVLPATLKILKELGFSEEELKGSGSQRRL